MAVTVAVERRSEAAREAERGKSSWKLGAGDEIVPGRTVVKGVGGGSRYEVFLVWDEDLYSLAIAKVIRPDQAEGERALRELGEEAELLERLAHPVIVRGFDALIEGPRPHLLIEHLEGPSLRDLLRAGGPLSLEQLLPLAMHVAGALVFMEHRGVVHLDVKPDNIIMGVPPRLIDLSIARSFERATRTRGVIGTDAYLAPEQTGVEDREGLMGPPADVWGLGATLHHCISGHRPFPRERDARKSADPFIRFPQLTEDVQPLPRWVPAELAELIAATLRRHPAERPTTVEVVERLEPLVVDLPSRLSFSRRGYRPG
ncbi:MAG: serine/threonine-protein kinase [bacterium]